MYMYYSIVALLLLNKVYSVNNKAQQGNFIYIAQSIHCVTNMYNGQKMVSGLSLTIFIEENYVQIQQYKLGFYGYV